MPVAPFDFILLLYRFSHFNFIVALQVVWRAGVWWGLMNFMHKFCLFWSCLRKSAWTNKSAVEIMPKRKNSRTELWPDETMTTRKMCIQKAALRKQFIYENLRWRENEWTKKCATKVLDIRKMRNEKMAGRKIAYTKICGRKNAHEKNCPTKVTNKNFTVRLRMGNPHPN